MKNFISVASELICLLLYLISSAIGNERIESLIQEDQNVKRRRERYQKQSSLLSTLTRQLSIHDNRAAAASSWSDSGATGTFIQPFSFFFLWMNREAWVDTLIFIGRQRVAQEPVEVLQGMTGWMPSTPLLMERRIHCQGTDQVGTAAATAIRLRTEMHHRQALVATAAAPRIGCHQHHHRVVHLTGIRI